MALQKETVAEADFQRQLDQFAYSSRQGVNESIPASQRMLFDYGGYITFNYLSVDDPAHNTHILREGDLVGFADLNLDNVQEVFVRGHMSYRDYGQGDEFGGLIEAGGQHSAVDQAYYRFDLQKYLSAYQGVITHDDASVLVGRQTVVFGNGLTFNQNIDGGVLNIEHGIFTLQGVAGQSVPETIDFDTSRPGFDDRTQRGFFGALISAQVGEHRPYVYFLSERDFNPDFVGFANINGNGIFTHFDYNATYVGAGSTGSLSDRLAYGLEGTFEGGNTLSNSFTSADMQAIQQYDNIDAFAADGRLDYLFADAHNTRASAEMIVASGDSDRTATNNTFGGNKAGTEDHAFNGFGLLNTGLSFAPQASNVLIERVGISSQPFNQVPLFRKMELGADVFFYEKELEDAPIDEASNTGRWLGWEPDVYLNYQITSDLTLAMRYGCFLPGSTTIGSAESGPNSVRQLFFTGVTLAF